MENDPRQKNPSRYEGRLMLKNGREVSLRPVLPTDGPLLLDLFQRISPESLYQRFLTRLSCLPEDMLHHFTHVDHEHELALAAVVQENGRDAIIAVARYARDPHGDLTDLAIAVRDDWQHLGLGKPLLARLMNAAGERGISRFVSMMDPRNAVMGRILKDLGLEVTYSLMNGSYHVEINIPVKQG